MKKSVKIGFPIACVVIVGGTLIALGNLKNQADKIAANRAVENSTNNVSYSYVDNKVNYSSIEVPTNKSVNQNISVNNTLLENTVTNTVNNNLNQNAVSNTSNSKNTSDKVNTTVKETKDVSKEKAIALVQKEWGEDSSVYFTNEGKEDNFYIIAVRDKENTSAKMFYKVDVDSETVEMDR